ncbi:uncharacterized protein (UPF0335 family) [Sphingobium sp. B2D3C]|nr:uncharacterized protein (UPF0335 family) [Sphingobium sp. B2D3C]
MQPQTSTPVEMRMMAVPDGMGGTVHKLMPVSPSIAAGKGKKKARPSPDPINANPDAAAQSLRQLIERLETLEGEKRGISDDIKDVYAEAKATGYDVKAVRAILRLRSLDPSTRLEDAAILETYLCALGME